MTTISPRYVLSVAGALGSLIGGVASFRASAQAPAEKSAPFTAPVWQKGDWWQVRVRVDETGKTVPKPAVYLYRFEVVRAQNDAPDSDRDAADKMLLGDAPYTVVSVRLLQGPAGQGLSAGAMFDDAVTENRVNVQERRVFLYFCGPDVTLRQQAFTGGKNAQGINITIKTLYGTFSHAARMPVRSINFTPFSDWPAFPLTPGAVVPRGAADSASEETEQTVSLSPLPPPANGSTAKPHYEVTLRSKTGVTRQVWETGLAWWKEETRQGLVGTRTYHAILEKWGHVAALSAAAPK